MSQTNARVVFGRGSVAMKAPPLIVLTLPLAFQLCCLATPEGDAMRFSLKWILAATVYVAIAAASFGCGDWYYADALWALTVLAVVYVATMAIFASGKRRVAAAAFLIASGSFLLCLTFGGDAVPTTRWLSAAGVDANNQARAALTGAPTRTSSTAPPTITGSLRYGGSANGPGGILVPTPQPAPSGNNAAAVSQYFNFLAATVPFAAPADFSSYVRAANAAATLAFGLMGSLVSLIAFRSAGRDVG